MYSITHTKPKLFLPEPQPPTAHRKPKPQSFCRATQILGRLDIFAVALPKPCRPKAKSKAKAKAKAAAKGGSKGFPEPPNDTARET